ncbi:hypothetical protein pdam_00016462 [Pocillopora damicornis]|uniref:G-protein coupled receptors family 1 profile domain-containing protein n=1 Tax=Pocillopora damicornis TaxID=46731 RepID=A0A3M6TR67_POCDA|nr:hypothetical protein pdam_00016462 [Pocillopora damicornis]
MQPLYSASQCIPWLVVLIMECLAIVILNIITIVVFIKKKRQLQRRSVYLIIHLAMVDLLAGAVSGPLQIENRMSQLCHLWNYRQKTTKSLVNPIIYALRMPGFREGLLQLFYRVPDLSNAPANLPLRYPRGT